MQTNPSLTDDGLRKGNNKMGKLKQEFEEKFCYEMMDLDGKNRHHYITPRVADKPQIIIEWIASKIKGNITGSVFTNTNHILERGIIMTKKILVCKICGEEIISTSL